MFVRKLCPRCKTGKLTYELDRRTPVCPYINCYSGKKCAMFEALDEDKKKNVFKSIAKKVFIKKNKV